MLISRLIDVFLFADGAGLQSSDGAFGWDQQQATAHTSAGCVGVCVFVSRSGVRCCYMECVITCEQKHGCGHVPVALMKLPRTLQLCNWVLLLL